MTRAMITVAVDDVTIEKDPTGKLRVKDDGITAAKIASDAVAAEEIASGAVGSAELATGAVDTDQLATSAVTTLKIANGAVSEAKVASGLMVKKSETSPTAILTKSVNEVIGDYTADLPTYTTNTVWTTLKTYTPTLITVPAGVNAKITYRLQFRRQTHAIYSGGGGGTVYWRVLLNGVEVWTDSATFPAPTVGCTVYNAADVQFDVTTTDQTPTFELQANKGTGAPECEVGFEVHSTPGTIRIIHLSHSYFEIGVEK